MKTRILISLLAASAAVPAAGDGPLNGKWRIHLSIADRQADATCAFVQNGGELTGSCQTAAGTSSVTGNVEEKKVSWTYKTETEANGTVTLKYRGTVNSPTEITGFVNVEEYGVEGEFTATQAN